MPSGTDRRPDWNRFATRRLPHLDPPKSRSVGDAYEVLGVLGSDPFADTLLVLSRTMHAVVVLKALKREHIQSPGVGPKFRQAMTEWVELGPHSNVVRAFLVDEIGDHPFVVYEWVAADERGLNTLRRYMDVAPPDMMTIVRWGVEICEGLEYVDFSGLLPHLNLTPETLHVTHEGTVQVADIGLMKVLAASGALPQVHVSVRDGRVGLVANRSTGVCLGTPTHMPPEQFLDAASCGVEADIYAIGVILYELLTGELPFTARAPTDDSEGEALRYLSEMYQRHRSQPVPEVDSPLYPIIARCLAKDASQRYDDLADLRQDLQDLADGFGDPPTLMVDSSRYNASQWVNRAMGLHSLGYLDTAMHAYARADREDANDPWLWRGRAACLSDMKRHPEALQAADRALALEPELAMGWYDRGTIHRKLNQPSDALQHLERALQLAPGEPLFWLGRAQVLQDLARLDEAREAYQAALEYGGGDAHIWYQAAGGLGRGGFAEEALQCFDKALELEPLNSFGWYERGNTLSALKRHQQALESFEKAVTLDPKHARAWFRLANAAETVGLLEQAADAYKQFLNVAPPDQQRQATEAKQRLRQLQEAGIAQAQRSQRGALSRHGVTGPPSQAGTGGFAAGRLHEQALQLHQQRRFHEAVDIFGKALAMDPSDATLWADAAASLLAAGQEKDALRCVKSAMELEPPDAALWSRLGVMLDQLGRSEEALRCHNRALRTDPKLIIAWYNKGLSLIGEDVPGYMLQPEAVEEAVECFDRGLRLDLKNPYAWYCKGLGLRAQARYDDSHRAFRRACDLDQRQAEFYAMLSRTSMDLGRTDQAIKAAKQAIRLDANSALAWTAKAAAERELRQYNDALDSCDRALAINRGSVRALHERARVLHEMGHPEKAIEFYNKAIQKVPDDPMLWLDRGLSEMDAGQNRAAARTFRQFLNTAPESLEDEIESVQGYIKELRKRG